MSGRVALVDFGSSDDADAALADVRKLDTKGSGIHDAAVVVRTAGGHIELHQTDQLAAGDGAVAGGAAGLVAGLLLGLPVAGAAVGLLGGGSWGLRDTGIPDERLRQLGRELEPGHAVLCVLVEERGLAQVREALAVYGEVLEAGVEPTAP
jgi:uncharacterized membrane protein